ncbi:MAG: 3-(3-hydroxyphenyl)propionate hydroxylase [Phenylobacterium sp.]|uniref:FAD-dependent oxidoreductase n=1 Tax=Phenylobacterium sp. TaxID=1871053 RepID=UPI0025E787ED|nr:FAD-dependent oxidoreductase [Phenylobacterium sp.]MBI1200625.1 3-(3-hydroxyphenyl)propionate hydroxylase [Phenylobacterium sp.]
MAATSTTAPQDLLPVLIAGAGPTGLMLACELARRGIAFRQIETSPAAQVGSRAKGLQPRSLEMFDNLGIVERVLEHGWLAIPMHSKTADGQVIYGGAIPDSLSRRPDIPYPASLVTPQWRTEEALRLRLRELGGTVEFGTALASFEQSEDRVTAVVVKDGVSETIQARWLVGCDGGHSVVRKQAQIAFEGEIREDVRMIIADLKVDGLDRECWHMWRHEEGSAFLCPLPSTDIFQYQASLSLGQNAETTLENLQAIFERRSGRTDIRLHDMEWSTVWRANIRLAERYRVGRAFIAGDAAHIHSPAGGQGMNTGMQDAANLGWKLAAVEKGASSALLDTYEAERRPIGAGVLSFSNARLEQSRVEGGVNVQRDESTLQLHINYRNSSLSRDDRSEDARMRAGDRAPDVTRLVTPGGERRLFDLLRGGRFTLLNFGPRLAAPIDAAPFDLRTLNVVEQPRHSDEIAEPDGQLSRQFGAGDRTLLLIRPDGYVAVISDAGDASAITSYFASIS